MFKRLADWIIPPKALSTPPLIAAPVVIPADTLATGTNVRVTTSIPHPLTWAPNDPSLACTCGVRFDPPRFIDPNCWACRQPAYKLGAQYQARASWP